MPCGHWEMVPTIHLSKILGIGHASCYNPTEPGTWVPRLWLAHPSLLFLSDYLQRRVKQVQRLLIDHTFVLFSYNRSILRASKHFCRAPAPVLKHSYPPCERRELLYAGATCWVRDGLIVWIKPKGPGGVSEINKRLCNLWNISQVMLSTLSEKC